MGAQPVAVILLCQGAKLRTKPKQVGKFTSFRALAQRSLRLCSAHCVGNSHVKFAATSEDFEGRMLEAAARSRDGEYSA